MRDLIRNYKLTIQGKNPESDTDCEPLMSSTSSIQDYGKTFPTNPNSYTSLYEELQRYSNTEGIFREKAGLLPTAKDIMTTANGSSTQVATNHSIVTIFSIWNTIMGTSVLAMAWGTEKSGLFSGICINLAIAAFCLYMAHILLSMDAKHGIAGQNFEVPELCRLLLGQWAEILAKVFSIVVLIGALIVYWVLMSNFLYNSVYFIYNLVINNTKDHGSAVLCKGQELFANTTDFNHPLPSNVSIFEKVWDLYSTVPLFLAVVMFPFLNFKSPTFFTKFNSLGTISVGYLLVFVAVKSFSWGVHIADWRDAFQLRPSFFALSGMLSMSYFIHNIIISIMRHNTHQEKNGRDLTIAFSLVTFTYLFIGVTFYITFPLAKSCIEDNILNNFSKGDTMTILARVLLLFQVFTVFPLVAFMLRRDVLTNMEVFMKNKDNKEFSYMRVIIINIIVLFVCIMFACFLPRIGTLIRYTGALSGMVYVFLLPSLLKMASLKKDGALTVPKIAAFTFIIIIGVINLICQFFIVDK